MGRNTGSLSVLVLGSFVFSQLLAFQRSTDVVWTEIAYLVWGTLLVGLMLIMRVEQREDCLTGLESSYFLFCLWAVFSMLYGQYYGASVWMGMREFTVFLWVVVGMAVAWLSGDEQHQLLFLTFFTVVGLIQNGPEVWLQFSALLKDHRFIRFPGTAVFHEGLFLVWLGRFLISGDRRIVVLLAYLGVNVLLSGTRGFWAGTLAGLIVGVGSTLVANLRGSGTPRRRAFWMTACLVLLVVGLNHLTGNYLFARSMSVLVALKDLSVVDRLSESRWIIQEILRSPVWGHGFGSSFFFYSLNPFTYGTTGYVEVRWAHDFYLYLLFKVGLIGTLAFAYWALAVLRTAWRQSKAASSIGLRGVAQGTFMLVVGMAVTSVSSPLFLQRNAMLFLGFLAGTVAYSSRQRVVEKRG
ncbi:MAG: O-antigen ligase family protein [Bacillota bacterium]|nr:O-antigen ligase family protein [Bacillota bacterium]